MPVSSFMNHIYYRINTSTAQIYYPRWQAHHEIPLGLVFYWTDDEGMERMSRTAVDSGIGKVSCRSGCGQEDVELGDSGQFANKIIT